MCTITLTLAKRGEAISGPYSSLTCFAGVRPGAVPERGEIEGHRHRRARWTFHSPDKDRCTADGMGRVAVIAARRRTVCGEVGRVPFLGSLHRVRVGGREGEGEAVGGAWKPPDGAVARANDHLHQEDEDEDCGVSVDGGAERRVEEATEASPRVALLFESGATRR